MDELPSTVANGDAKRVADDNYIVSSCAMDDGGEELESKKRRAEVLNRLDGTAESDHLNPELNTRLQARTPQARKVFQNRHHVLG